jgi:hypothetical protein
MTESQEFIEFRDRIMFLEQVLLPSSVSNESEPTPEDVIKILSFRLMAHAKIEDFVESRVENIAISASAAFENGVVSKALLSIASFTESSLGAPAQTLAPSQPSQAEAWRTKLHLAERTRKYVTAFVRSIKSNHGIKEENLLALLLPVGVPADSIDPLWLADCASFGSERGDAAHRSSSRVSTTPNPFDERNKVYRIVEGLRSLDAEIARLLNELARAIGN